jgi:hypothetical protein
VIGECKDRGGTIEDNDVANIRAIADAFPSHRFEVFILLAKLAPFTEEEIARASRSPSFRKTDKWRKRLRQAV